MSSRYDESTPGVEAMYKALYISLRWFDELEMTLCYASAHIMRRFVLVPLSGRNIK